MKVDLHSIPRFVINLPTRPERLDQFRLENRHMFSSATRVWPGVVAKTPMQGCAEAHLGLMRLALEEGWPYLLVMEDDCVFHAGEKTRTYADLAYANLPDRWEVALGGVYQARTAVPVNPWWWSASGWSATHFYVITAEGCRKTVAGYDPKQHVDVWMSKNLRALVAREMFATQRAGFSDNVGKQVDYSHMLVRAEQRGMRLLK